jgi:hypothetical protein
MVTGIYPLDVVQIVRWLCPMDHFPDDPVRKVFDAAHPDYAVSLRVKTTGNVAGSHPAHPHLPPQNTCPRVEAEQPVQSFKVWQNQALIPPGCGGGLGHEGQEANNS